MTELLVVIQIAGRRCALSAHDVKSVIELGSIAPVPRAPDFITGITALRSQSLTVIDCRRALGLSTGLFYAPQSFAKSDEVVTLAEIKAEDGSSYRAFVTQTMNPYGYPAKDRSGQLDLLEPPDLRALIEKCAAATQPKNSKE